MSRRTLVLVATIGALLALPATAAAHVDPYSIQGDFICISCHEPLNQVNSPEAQSEKATLARLADSGLGLPQIKTRMVAYYGEEVLAQPPAHGLNLLVYVLPPAVVLLGLAFVVSTVPRWRRRGVSAGPITVGGPEPDRLDPGDAARLDAELRAFRG